jgi:hypothetical protein
MNGTYKTSAAKKILNCEMDGGLFYSKIEEKVRHISLPLPFNIVLKF